MPIEYREAETVLVVTPMMYEWIKNLYGEITHLHGARIVIKERLAKYGQKTVSDN